MDYYMDSIAARTMSSMAEDGLRIANIEQLSPQRSADSEQSFFTHTISEQHTPQDLSRPSLLSKSRYALHLTQSQISPPLTPQVSFDELSQPRMQSEEPHFPTFTNYLRAFHHFHPSSAVASITEESSITVPINRGDVILVHSIHANGWADGTLLESGARGWLPTNYCEVYDPPSMRNLMNALTHLWDLVRNGENDSLVAFTRQDYVRAMIAGVRFFLERTGCLSRESSMIVSHVALRRLRKHLLGDLSAMVKIAKELQATLQGHMDAHSVYELLDELVLKAFKVATRSIRFGDIWNQDMGRDMMSMDSRPPTPPTDLIQSTHELDATAGAEPSRDLFDAQIDSAQSDGQTEQTVLEFNPTELSASQPMPVANDEQQQQTPETAPAQSSCMEQTSLENVDNAGTVQNQAELVDDWTIAGQERRESASVAQAVVAPPMRLSSLAGRAPIPANEGPSSPAPLQSRAAPASPLRSPTAGTSVQHPKSTHIRSTSAQHGHHRRFSVSHRLSYASRSGNFDRQNLASERLTVTHDAFLSLLGTFIGLHLQSRSRYELSNTTTQSVAACKQLLAVVEEVWARDAYRSESLGYARDMMYTRLADLVTAAKAVLAPLSSGEEVLDLESTEMLVGTTTQCIRAAGDCVGRTRSVIERIGDFEFEMTDNLALADEVFAAIDNSEIAELEDRPQTETLPASRPLSAGAEGEDRPDAQSGTPVGIASVGVPPEPASRPPPPPALVTSTKPLPDLPAETPTQSYENNDSNTLYSPTEASPEPCSYRSSGSSIQQFPRMSTSIINQLPQVLELPAHEFTSPNTSFDSSTYSHGTRTARTDSSNVDMHSAWNTGLAMAHSSTVSLASTRATTPERSPVLLQSGVTSMMGSFSSISELQALAVDELSLEEQVLEKTFAHELIYNKEGQVSGGSLPALVERLTYHDTTPDATFVTTFYLTFRLFTSPRELAAALIDRFNYVGDGRLVGLPVRLRVFNVFKGWLESHWHNEVDAEAAPMIEQFADQILRTALPSQSPAKRLLELLKLQVDPKSVGGPAVVPRLASTISRSASAISLFTDGQTNTPNITKSQLNALKAYKAGGSACSILDFDPLELARQFTLIESGIYCKIGPEELLASEWTKKKSISVNVKAMAALSTDLTNLVADTVLGLEDPKKRAVIIKQWIKISMKCLDLNNYDSLFAIISSLNSSIIQRLNKTWNLMSQKTMGRFKDLTAIIDIGRNYSVLRQKLQNHLAPCIPFVGMYLTDLTFVDVGNQVSRQLPDDGSGQRRSVINFDKHMKTAKIIGQIQRFQVPYKLTPVPELQDWMEQQIQRMRNSEEADVHHQYRRSLRLEPREVQVSSAMPPPQILRRQESTLSMHKVDSHTGSDMHRSKESVGGMKDKFNVWALNNLHIGGGSSSHSDHAPILS